MARYIIWFLSVACIALAVGLGIRIYSLRCGGGQKAGTNPAFDLKASYDTPREYFFDPPPMGGVPMTLKVWNRDVIDFADDAMGSRRLVETIEREVSSWREESITCTLNSADENDRVELAGHVYDILKRSFAMYEKTGGVFNPASGALIELWKEGARVDRLPEREQIEEAKGLCELNNFVLDEESMQCTKRKGGARLDFGGIAKGYIIDKTAEYLKTRGVEQAIVTAGGDLRIIGDVSRTVGIRHPLKKRGSLYGSFYLRSGAAATSGAYERFHTIEDRNYGHIIDPRTGYPVDGPLSVTVIAGDCSTADAFATALYILGREKGFAMIGRHDGVEALVLVKKNGGIQQFRTKGFPEVNVESRSF